MSYNRDPDVLERIRILETRDTEKDQRIQNQDKKIGEQDRKIEEQDLKIQDYEAKYNDLIQRRDSVQNKQIMLIGFSFLGGLCLGHYSTKLYYSLDQRPLPR